MAKEILIGIFFVIVGLGVGLWYLPESEVTADKHVSQVPPHEQPLKANNPVKEIKISAESLEVIQKDDVKEAIQVSIAPDTEKDNLNYEKAIQLLNEDADNNVKSISAYINKLKPEEDMLRMHLINLVMQTNADARVKGEFLKDYLVNAEFIVKDNDLADNSVSAITAIDYFGQLFQKKDEATEYLAEINTIDNDALKDQLLKRMHIYFPEN